MDSKVNYLTIFSIFNTCGRIFVGFGSEALASKVPRPCFLAISAALTAVAFLLFHLGAALLAPCAGLVGFALGGSFALQAVLIEEIFGPKARHRHDIEVEIRGHVMSIDRMYISYILIVILQSI